MDVLNQSHPHQNLYSHHVHFRLDRGRAENQSKVINFNSNGNKLNSNVYNTTVHRRNSNSCELELI